MRLRAVLAPRARRARRARRALLAVTAVSVVSVVVLSGCTAASDPATEPGGDGSTTSAGSLFDDATVAPLVDALPEKTVKALPESRLADGLLPPTNRWFSGLVFGEVSQPVFPLPLSFQLTDAGFTMGLPTVATTDKLIAGGNAPMIEADVGADTQVVTAYDTSSVTIEQRTGNVALGSTMIAQGSPFVTFTAAASVNLALMQTFTAAGDSASVDSDSASGDDLWTTEVGGVTYGLVSDGDFKGSGVALEADQYATLFALADGGDLDAFADAALNPITGTSLDYSVGADGATTTIDYGTDTGAATLIAAMPHQAQDCDAGTYASIYGTLPVCATSSLEWKVDTVTPTGELDLTTLSADQKATLATQIDIDVASSADIPADTYYGGKALYRLVNLWSIARQVGADAAATSLKETVVAELDRWMEPDGCEAREDHCFVYDAEARGLVGLPASFGSDEFNDHHFHYGYFLFAAGVLAADDSSLVEKWAPVMNLVAADIATDADGTYFPTRRVFDAYAGHSWASGSSPFGDGNNQESSSEAVSAWNGLALWAAASDQDDLATEATWMLSAEAASSMAYWTNFDQSDPVYDGFDHSITSLVWGGKRDYATWFSAEPSAMLGILVLPMSPVSGYLAGDPERIEENIADAAASGFNLTFGDYLLMYQSLAGPEQAAAALAETDSLNEEWIDDGNSRSYLLAFIMSQL
jgi:endoglucanase Acf2